MRLLAVWERDAAEGMSYRFQATVICDKCGEKIESPVEVRSTRVAKILWDLKHIAKAHGWFSVLKGSRPEEHYCEVCSATVTVVKIKFR